MKFAKKSSSVASSSDGDAGGGSPSHHSGRVLRQLHKRIGHAAAAQNSMSDWDAKTAGSSPSETDKDSDSGDDIDDDTGGDDATDLPMGERVSNLEFGPDARRRYLRAPDIIPRQNAGHMQPDAADKFHINPAENIKRRVNKNAPVEERICRRPVSVVRDSVQKKSVKAKDPRFWSRNKTEDKHEADVARRRFGFLFHETMPVEVKELNAAMRNSTDARDHRQLQVKLSRLQQSLKQHEDRSLELQVEQEWKASQKAQIEAGKKPFYLKQSEKKARVMEKKFAQLEETGQLEKYIAKKRKRVASKMHKKLPFRRTRE